MCNSGYYLTALYWKMLKNTSSLLRTTICLSGHAFFVRIATNISKNFKQLKSWLCSSIWTPGINRNKNYSLNPISKSIKSPLLWIKYAFPSLKVCFVKYFRYFVINGFVQTLIFHKPQININLKICHLDHHITKQQAHYLIAAFQRLSLFLEHNHCGSQYRKDWCRKLCKKNF